MVQYDVNSRGQRRLLMLGLDAISLPFVRENLDRLPAFSALLASGTLRELQSPAAHMSATVWPTFATGRHAGEHGQYFPFQWSANERRYRRLYDPYWSSEFGSVPFWYRIARAGHPVIVFDIADLVDAARAPCLQIANWCQQSSGAAKSSDPLALRDIQRRFGRRPIGVEVPVPKTARQSAVLRASLVRSARAKAEATLHLMNRPWNLFVTSWSEVHRAGHNLWPVEGDFASDVAPGEMLAVYAEVDRQLARLIAEVDARHPDASMLVFSIHGMEPNSAQNHFLDEILARLNRRYLARETRSSTKPLTPNAMAFLRRTLPPALQYRAARLLGERVQDWVVNRAAISGKDWGATPSFALLSGGDGFVRLSIKGREADGFFEADGPELASYTSWLVERLLAIRVAQSGEPLIRKVVDVDTHFPGPRRHFLPDLILQWGPDAPANRIASPDIGEIEVSLATGRGGNHNAQAFLIAKGDETFLRLVHGVQDVAQIGSIASGLLMTEPSPVKIAAAG